jgi:hypothetical protein
LPFCALGPFLKGSEIVSIIFLGLVFFVLLSLVPDRYSSSRKTAWERFVDDRLSWATVVVQSLLYLILFAGCATFAAFVVYSLGAHIAALVP